MKKVMITGAGGFLGSSIVKMWTAEMGELHVISSQMNLAWPHYVSVYNRQEVLSPDFNLDKFDVIIHCAFPKNAEGKDFYEGILYSKNMIEKIGKTERPFFINISSQSLYDQARITPASELSPLCLDSTYALGKYMIECLVEALCEKSRYTNLRLASLIGPKQDKRIVNRFISAVLSNNSIEVFRGNQQIEYMDVRDAADAIITVVNKYDNRSFSPVYNIGINHTYGVLEIAEKVSDIAREYGDYDSKIHITDITSNKNTGLISDMFFADMEWHPSISLDDSIRTIFESMIDR